MVAEVTEASYEMLAEVTEASECNHAFDLTLLLAVKIRDKLHFEN